MYTLTLLMNSTWYGIKTTFIVDQHWEGGDRFGRSNIQTPKFDTLLLLGKSWACNMQFYTPNQIQYILLSNNGTTWNHQWQQIACTYFSSVHSQVWKSLISHWIISISILSGSVTFIVYAWYIMVYHGIPYTSIHIHTPYSVESHLV